MSFSARFIQPMLADPIDVVPEGADFVLEPKLDGWRCVAIVSGSGIELRTRTGKLIDQVPYINRALRSVPAGTILDGEIVDLASATQFNRVASILQRKDPHVLRGNDTRLSFVIFDILALFDESLMDQPLSVRRGLLEQTLTHPSVARHDGPVPWPPVLRLVEQLPASEAAADAIIAEGFEGVVVKRLSGVYLPDVREWSKLKPDAEVEALCTGTFATESGSQYEGRAVGGITFRIEHEDGRVYEGRAAGRMDNALREELYQHPERFVGLVVELGHWGIGEEGALRHPSFRRFRDPADKAVPTPVRTARVVARQARSAGPSGRMRNYRQMKDPKLMRSIAELEAGEGEAYVKALAGSGDPAADLEVSRAIATERGLI